MVEEGVINDDNITMTMMMIDYGGQRQILSSWCQCSMCILTEKFVSNVVCRGQIMPSALIAI